jgi:hypothetical protein
MLEIPGDVGTEEFDASFQYKPVKATRSGGDLADIKAAARL